MSKEVDAYPLKDVMGWRQGLKVTSRWLGSLFASLAHFEECDIFEDITIHTLQVKQVAYAHVCFENAHVTSRGDVLQGQENMLPELFGENEQEVSSL